MAEVYTDLKDRPLKDTICLFDVDNTLTPARRPVSAEMRQTLSNLRKKCAIGYVITFQIDPIQLPRLTVSQG
jgi:phosphomannomutase